MKAWLGGNKAVQHETDGEVDARRFEYLRFDLWADAYNAGRIALERLCQEFVTPLPDDEAA